MKICLIDDDKTFGFYLCKRLKCFGIESSHFESYLPIIEKQLFDFDLYIVDIKLKGENGVEFIKLLKDINVDKKIFVSSGYINENTQRKLTELGVHHFLLKPYSSEFIVNKIQSIQY